MSLTQAVKKEAHRLGFSLVGVTTPEPPPHWPAYEHWLNLGRHGSMDYLTDRRRADPRLVLPECQSILVLAVRYPNPGSAQHLDHELATGQVASYAWGQDYHLVLPSPIENISILYRDTGWEDRSRTAGTRIQVRCWNGIWLNEPGWAGSERTPASSNPKSVPISCWLKSCWASNWSRMRLFSADRCGKCTRCMDCLSHRLHPA